MLLKFPAVSAVQIQSNNLLEMWELPGLQRSRPHALEGQESSVLRSLSQGAVLEPKARIWSLCLPWEKVCPWEGAAPWSLWDTQQLIPGGAHGVCTGVAECL